MTKVYLVGDKNSPKTNQWLSMTADKELALQTQKDAGPEATFKEVTVRPSRTKRKAR